MTTTTCITCKKLAGLGLLLLALPACGPTATQVDTNALTPLAYYAAQATTEAQATAVAAETTRQAQALAIANATATVAAVTATANAQASATAGAATATIAAVQVRGTVQAQDAQATAQARDLAATATAQVDAAAFERAAAAAEATRIAIANDAARIRVERAETVNRALPGLIIVFGASLLSAVAAYVYRSIVHAHPQQAGDAWVAWNRTGPVVVTVPARLPTTGPARLQIPARTATAATTPTDSRPVPLPEFRHGHAIIIGETGSGKSTAMRRLLSSRHRVTVLDPHATGDDWSGATIVGAGRDFDAIRETMNQMQAELHGRYAARAAQKGEITFEPWTVAVDEMPAVVAAIGRDIEQVWREWLREGRKVGCYLVLATQSARVRTLGIEGERDLLENFTVAVYLGDIARSSFGPLVDGMDFPAVIQTRGKARPVIIDVSPDDTAAGNGHSPSGSSAASGPGTAPLGPGTAATGPGHMEPLMTLQPPAYADPADLSEHDRARIIALYERRVSLAEIGRQVFGYEGGAGFYAIKDTLGLP